MATHVGLIKTTLIKILNFISLDLLNDDIYDHHGLIPLYYVLCFAFTCPLHRFHLIFRLRTQRREAESKQRNTNQSKFIHSFTQPKAQNRE